VGEAILKAAPYLMKGLTIVGTAAMFLVGGGILTHGVPALHHAIEKAAQAVGGILGALVPTLLDALTGVVAGALTLVVVTLAQKVWALRKKAAA
jgi:predicted DNA repair protein MutK